MSVPPLLRRLPLAFAVGLAVIVPAAIQTQPRPSHLADQVAPNGGDPLFVTWVMASESHTLAHHPSQVFAANIFYPRRDAIAWSDNLLVAAPLYGVLLTLAGGRLLVAYNLITLLGFAGVSLAVYALAKELIGRRGPALVAAAVFGLSMSRSISVGHTQLAGFLFVVLAVLALVRFLDRRRWSAAVAFGLAAAASWLTTAYYAVMLALVVVPFLAVWLAQRRLRIGRRFWAGMAVAGVVGFAVVAPTLAPYVRLQRSGLFDRSPHGVPGVAWSELWRLPPSLWYRLVDGVDTSVRYDKAGLFPGLVLTVLVVVAVVAAVADRVRRRPLGPRRGTARWAWPLAAGCVVCLAVMVGPDQPGGLSAGYVGLRAAVPGVASLRDLTRFWAWPLLCLSLLAGVGADRLLARFHGRWQVVTAVGLLAVVWAELLFRPQVANVDLSPRATAVNHALAHLPPGPVMELPEPLGPTFPYVTAGRQLRSLIDHDPRIDGYSGSVPPEIDTIDRLATRIGPAELVPIMRRYGVRYLVLHSTARPCGAGYSAGELTFILHSLGTVNGVEQIVSLGGDRIVALAPAPIDRTLPVVGPGGARPSRCTRGEAGRP